MENNFDFEKVDTGMEIPVSPPINVDTAKKDSPSFSFDKINTNDNVDADAILPKDINVGTVDFNKYKKYVGDYYFLGQDIDEKRAQNQSGWEQALNGVIKGAGLAASSFGQAFTSVPYGIASAINQGKVTNLYDNEVSRKWDEFSKYMEETFPNYRTHAEQEANPLNPVNWFNTNFIFDGIIKNLGMIGGMIGSGAIIARGIQGFGKLVMAGKLADEMTKVANLENSGATLLEAMNQVGNSSRLITGSAKLGAATISSGVFANIAGLATKDQMTSKLIENYKLNNFGAEPQGDDLKEIDDIASSAGNVVYGINLPLFAMTEMINFGRAISGYKDMRKAINSSSIKGEIGSLEAIPKTLAERIGTAGKPIIHMAGLMGTAHAADIGVQDYYTRKYDGESKGFIKDVISSTMKGLHDTFGTNEGLESMVIGGLTGAIFGIGGYKNAFKKVDPKVQEAIDNLNSYVNSKEFGVRFDSAVRAESLRKDMDTALENEDIYQFKNFQHDRFKNFIDTAVKLGRYDLAIDFLKEQKELSKEEFEKTWGLTKDGNEKSVGQYIDKLIVEAKNLKDIRETIDERFPHFNDAIRDNLFDAASGIKNVDAREAKLSAELSTLTKGRISYEAWKGADSAEEAKIKAEQLKNWKETDSVDYTVNEAKVKELITDLGKLKERRFRFAEEYRNLIDTDYREAKQAAFAEREKEAGREEFENWKIGKVDRIAEELQPELALKNLEDLLKNEKDKDRISYIKEKIKEVKIKIETEKQKKTAETVNTNVKTSKTNAATQPKVELTPSVKRQKLDLGSDNPFNKTDLVSAYEKWSKTKDYSDADIYNFKDALNKHFEELKLFKTIGNKEGLSDAALKDRIAKDEVLKHFNQSGLLEKIKKHFELEEVKENKIVKSKNVVEYTETENYDNIVELINENTEDSLTQAVELLKKDKEVNKDNKEITNFINESLNLVNKELEKITGDSGEEKPVETELTEDQEVDKVNEETEGGEVKKTEGGEVKEVSTEEKKTNVELNRKGVPVGASANIYPQGLVDAIGVEDDGHRILNAEDDAIIRKILSDKFGVGSPITFKIEVDNDYKMPEGGHTLETLPIKIIIDRKDIDLYINRVDGIVPQIEFAQKLLAIKYKIPSPKTVKALKALTDEAKDSKWKLGFILQRTIDLTPDHPLKTENTIETVISDLQENLKGTLELRKQIWEAHNKGITDLNGSISYKNGGSVIKGEEVSLNERFGANEDIWYGSFARNAQNQTDTLISSKTGDTHVRSVNTSRWTNFDAEYNRGTFYIRVKLANGTMLPVPVKRAHLTDGEVTSVTKNIANLLKLLKEGNSLDSQAVMAIKDEIEKYITIDYLKKGKEIKDDKLQFKVNSDSIEIGYRDSETNQKRKLTLWTHGYDEGERYEIEGYNLVVSDMKGETLETVDSIKDKAQFNDLVKAAIRSKLRNVDYKKLSDKEYREWLIKSDAFLTDVGELKDSKGKVIGNVSPIDDTGLKTPLVLSVSSLLQGKSEVKKKEEIIVPPVNEKVETTSTSIKVFQGRKTKDLDSREFNYYSLTESEAKDYGEHIDTKDIDISNFLIRHKTKDEKEYWDLIHEFRDKTGKTFDILNNDKEGLEIQKDFFSFLRDKGYNGFSTYTAEEITKILENPSEYDNKYIVTFFSKKESSKDIGGSLDNIYQNKREKSTVISDVTNDLYGFNDKGETNSRKALDTIQTNNLNPELSIAIELLSDNVHKNTTSIRIVDELKDNEGDDIPAAYVHSENIIYINSTLISDEKQLQKDILHEIGHALELSAFESDRPEDIEFVKAVTELFNFAKQEIKKKYSITNEDGSDNTTLAAKLYGTINPKEFLAELKSNPDFINILKELPAKEKRFRNFWENLLDWIRHLFKGKKYNNLFEQADTLLTDFINNTFQYRKTTGKDRVMTPQGKRKRNAFTPEIDAHYVNIISNMVQSIIKNEPFIRIKDIKANPELNVKARIYNTLTDERFLSRLNTDIQSGNQRDNFTKLAESINDYDENGVWNNTKQTDTLGIWQQVIDRTNLVFGKRIDEDFSVDENPLAQRNWDDRLYSKYSTRNTVSTQIKVYVASLIKLKSQDTKVVGDNIIYDVDKKTLTGIAETVDFDSVYPTIKKNMLGAISPLDILDRVNSMIKIDPTYIKVYNDLKKNEDLLAAWFSSFGGQNPTVLFQMYNRTATGTFIKVDEANKASNPKYILANRWINNIKVDLVKKVHKEVKDKYIELEKKMENTLQSNDFEEASNNLSKMFNLFGIDITPHIILSEINDKNNIEEHTSSKFVFDKLFKTPLRNIADNVFNRPEKLTEVGNLNKLAEVVHLYHPDIAEMTFQSVTGNREYSVTLPNSLTRFFNISQSKRPEQRDKLAQIISDHLTVSSMKYSNWLHNGTDGKRQSMIIKDDNGEFTLNNNFFNKFEVVKFNGIKITDSGEGDDYSGISSTDNKIQHLVYYLLGKGEDKLYHRSWGIIAGLNPADSGVQYGFHVPKIRLLNGELDVKNKKISRTSNVWKAVASTVWQEIEAFKAARKLLFETDNEGNIIGVPNLINNAEVRPQLYVDYQLDKNGNPAYLSETGKPLGNIFKFHNAFYTKGSKVIYLDEIEGVKDSLWTTGKLDADGIAKVKDFIDEFIASQIDITLKDLKSEEIEETLRGKYAFVADESLDALKVEYALNRYIHGVEMNNFFYGNINEFKPDKSGRVTIDPNKRAKNITSPGTPNSMVFTGEHYNGLTIADVVKTNKEYIKTLKKALGKNFDTSGYEGVTTSDSFAVATLDRARDIMRNFGKWGNLKNPDGSLGRIEQLYQDLKAKKEIPFNDLAVFFQIFKPSYVDRVYDEGLNRFVLKEKKLSLLPLIPSLTDGTQMDVLRRYMEENGIHETYFASVDKVGNQGIYKVDEDGIINEELLSKVIPETLSNAAWQIQQDVPQHLQDEHNKLPIQRTNIPLANLALDGDYKLGDKTVKGKELGDIYQDVFADDIVESENNLKRKLGVTDNKIGLEELQELFIQEIKARGLNNEFLNALELVDDGLGNMRFVSPVFQNNISNKLQAIATSLWTNNVTNRQFPGGHVVNASSVFFDIGGKKLSDLIQSKHNTDGWEYTKEFLELAKERGTTKLQMKVVEDEHGTHTVAEVAVAAWSKEFFKDKKRISIDLIPAELRKMIFDRIPMDKKSSTLMVDIVAFLPTSSGSMAIFPDDAITQTGFDFDLDTSYVIYYNFETNPDGTFKKVEMDYSTEKEAIQKRYNRYTVNEEIIKVYNKYRPELDALYEEKDKLFEAAKVEVDDLNKEFLEKKKDLKEEITIVRENIKYTAEDADTAVAQDLMNAIFHNGANLQEQLINLTSELSRLKDDYYRNKLASYNEVNEYNDKIKAVEDEREKELDEERAKIISKEEFSGLSIYRQNPQSARQNLIIDIYAAIQNSTHALEEVATPTSSPDLERITKQLNDLVGQGNIHPYNTAKRQDIFREENIASMAVRGIAANINRLGTILQYVGAELNPKLAIISKVKLGVKELTLTDKGDFVIGREYKLSTLKKVFGKDNVIKQGDYAIIIAKKFLRDSDGGYKNILQKNSFIYASQALALIVDAVKKGFPSNINTYTYNGWISMILTGMDFETATMFYNQPIIRDATAEYFDNEGLFSSDENSINTIRRKYQTRLYNNLYPNKPKKEVFIAKIDIEKRLKYNPNIDLYSDGKVSDNAFTLNLEELLEQIELNKKYKSLKGDEKIAFLKYQLKALEAFIKYNRNTGKAINDLQKVVLIDGIGASPSLGISDNIVENIEASDRNGSVLVGEKSLARAIYPKHFKSEDRSVYPLVQQYLESSNKSSVKLLSPLFIQRNPIFRGLVENIMSNITFKSSEKRDRIQRKADEFVLSLVTRNLPYLQKFNSATLLGIGSEIIDIDDITLDKWVDISVGNQIFLAKKYFMKGQIVNQPYHILNFLQEHISNDEIERNKYHAISFTNPTSPVTEKIAIETLLQMFHSKDEKVKSLAENLIAMNYFTDGFQYTANSIAKIIPNEIFSDNAPNGIGLSNYLYDEQARLDALSKIEENEQGVSLLYSDKEARQIFTRNNWKNSSVVPLAITQFEYEEGLDEYGRRVIAEKEVEGQKFPLTVGGTPVWIPKGNGLLVIPTKSLERSSRELQNANEIRIKVKKVVKREVSYTNRLYTKYGEVGKNTYYYPINPLGATNFFEINSKSIIPENNVEKDVEHYIKLIETIAGIKDESVETNLNNLRVIPVSYNHGGKTIQGDEVKTINGKSNIDNEIDGIRTETTRSSKQFDKPKVGEYEIHKGLGKQILVKVVTEPYTPNKEDFNKYEGYAVDGWDTHSKHFTKDWFSYKFEFIKEIGEGKGGVVVENTPKSTTPIQRVLEFPTDISTSTNPTDFTNHSGGAVGADSQWDIVGREFGVTKHNHYYHGEKTPKGNTKISDEQLAKGWQHVLKANKTLRRKPDNYKSLLSRNWFQVKNSDAVFAIAPLKSMTEVEGGTGWAVQMAIDAGKPVYVFSNGAWTKWNGYQFENIETPTLTQDFAGIGSRTITKTGIDAIREVYKKTFGGSKNPIIDKETKDTLKKNCK